MRRSVIAMFPGAMSVVLLLVHCNSDYSVGQGVDDASAADALLSSDASVSQDGGALPDANAMDVGLTPDAPRSSTSFCADAGGSLFCADFDDANVDAGWVGLEQSGGGSLSVMPTFSGGSAPSALVGALSSGGGSALLVTRSIAIGAGISIMFSFDASAVTQPVTVVVGDFGFANSELASFQSPTAFFCFGNLATAAAGRNVVEMRLTPNTSTCSINNQLIVSQATALPASVILRLGVAGSDAGAASIAFDDFLVRPL